MIMAPLKRTIPSHATKEGLQERIVLLTYARLSFGGSRDIRHLGLVVDSMVARTF
jgi:hypothetical protein